MIRIFGVVAIVAFTVLSFVVFDRTVQPGVDPVDLQPSKDTKAVEADEGSVPEFLSFAAEIEPGEYRVSDPVDKKSKRLDKDIIQRKKDLEKSDRTPLDSLSEIKGGVYTTAFGVENCSYALSAVQEDRVERDIGTDSLPKGRVIVTIEEIEPDRFSSDDACGSWSKWSPLVDQLTTASNGDYWTGDLAPGVWQVPAGCMWEKVIAFRGSRLSDVEENGIGPTPLEVTGDTTGVRLRGCSKPIVFAASS